MGTVLRAQPAVDREARSASVSLLVMSPGQSFDQFFGHMAVRVRDDATGEDVTYNWGTYRQHGMELVGAVALRRVRSYRVVTPTPILLGGYAAAGRSVTEYSLRLSDGELASLRMALASESPDSVRVYDYLRDNCATPVRDLLAAVFPGDFKGFLSRATTTTYRSALAPYFRPHTGYAIATSFVMGRPAEVPLSQWDVMFLPDQVVNGIAAYDLTRPAPERRIVQRRELVPLAAAQAPASRAVPYAVGVAVLLAVAMLVRAGRGGSLARALAGLALALLGVLGTIAVLMWGATDHWISSWNLRVLSFSPLLVAGGIALWRRGRVAVSLLGVLFALACLAVVVSVVAGFSARSVLDCVASAGVLALAWWLARRASLREAAVMNEGPAGARSPAMDAGSAPPLPS